MSLFLQWFVFPVAAGIVVLIFANPMGLDWTQRITLFFAIVFFASFLARTMTKRAENPTLQPSQPHQQSNPSIQQSTSGPGSVAIIGDGNTVETNAARDKRRLRLRPTSMQIQVGAELFQAPSIKVTNISDIGITIEEAGCVVGEGETHRIKGLRADGKLNRSWPYHLKPAESADAYLYPVDLEALAGKEIREVYVQTGDEKRYRVNDPNELAEFIKAVNAISGLDKEASTPEEHAAARRERFLGPRTETVPKPEKLSEDKLELRWAPEHPQGKTLSLIVLNKTPGPLRDCAIRLESLGRWSDMQEVFLKTSQPRRYRLPAIIQETAIDPEDYNRHYPFATANPSMFHIVGKDGATIEHKDQPGIWCARLSVSAGGMSRSEEMVFSWDRENLLRHAPDPRAPHFSSGN